MKPNKKGLERVIAATGYSIKGIQYSWKHEAAFRQELLLACCLIPAALFVGESASEKALLILCVFIVLIAELLNSAIEAIVDKASPDLHPLAAAAKDCGSAAVFFALSATITVWAVIILSKVLPTA
ncbi:MAG: diacylglycerol kinase [Acidiferrobacterales bacterium]|nr:diacylglycerol kinase [Acidiferrobacterales bacterium]